eukprot:3488971-Ditylum_brightwellii.AAC.1
MERLLSEISGQSQPFTNGIRAFKKQRSIQQWFVEFRGREFKDGIVDFVDNNIGDMSTEIAHGYKNKCICIIMGSNSLFDIDMHGSDSDSENKGSSSIFAEPKNTI